MLTVHVADRLDEVDRDEWDGIGTDPFSRTAVLDTLVRAELPGVRLRYVTIRDERRRLVAAAPVARMPIDAGRLTHGAFRRGIHGIRTVRPGFLHTRLVLCGTPLSIGNGPARVIHDTNPVAVYRTLAGVLHDVGDAEDASWRVFKEFGAAEIDAARAALSSVRHRWVIAPSEPGNVLQTPWLTYEAFLQGLRSHYRYKIRKATQLMRDAGVAVDRVPLGEAYDDRAHRLYEAVVDSAQVQLERLTPDFFVRLGRTMGPAATLHRFRRDGALLGWVATLRHGDMLYDMFHGIDYAHNESLALYFNQLAEVLRYGAECGVERVVLGQSTDTAKARFGAESVPLWIAVAHRTRVVTGTMRRAERLLFPARAPVQRRVFRA
jgi:predicted N-acyltransferase